MKGPRNNIDLATVDHFNQKIIRDIKRLLISLIIIKFETN